MGLGDSLFLTIVDKLLIGVVLLIAGLWLNERLEKLKGQIGLQNVMVQKRALAFGSLWELTQPLTPRGDEFPTEDDCKGAFEHIRRWYYSEAGAMHLSFEATSQCLMLLKALEKRESANAKTHASGLRTQLKVDIGVYTKSQARTSFLSAGQ
jgi:hypothetical protein